MLRTHHASFLAALVATLALPLACASGTDTGDATGGGVGGGGNTNMAGVGDTCSEALACRPGLACNSGATCELGHSLLAGAPCTISGECKNGLQCAATAAGSQCQAAGGAVEGEACTADLDCISGLRCTIEGFNTICSPEGTGDVGAACTTSAGCYAGLACASGSCAPALPGAPSFGLPTWRGVSCDPPGTAAPVALFELPGAQGSAGGDFFRSPFPSDARKKAGKLDLAGFPTPGTELLGWDPVQRYVDAVSGSESAWGAYPTVIFRFSAPVDFDSFRSPNTTVNWIDVTPGAPEYGSNAGLYWFASEGRSKYVCEHWFGVRRPRGAPLLPGHTYAIWLTTEARDKVGQPVKASPQLVALMGDAPPADPALADPHTAFAPFRAYLADQGMPASSVLNAAVVTVGDHRAPMRELAAAVEAAPAPTSAGWVRCGGGAASPCPDASGDRACGAGDPAFDEYHALVSLPIFQQGEAPYLEAPAGKLQTSAPVRSEDVCMALTVPKGTMPTAGWPVVVFAHGTGGSFRSHVGDTVAGALANAAAPGGSVQFAVLGIDQVQHGPRRGSSTKSPNDLFFNFANPDAARGNPLQGAADQVALGRFAAGLDLDAATTGGDAIKLDPANVFFFGHSQGATHGSLAMPYADAYRAVVLSGNGASLMHSLLTKTKPVNISAAVPFVLGDFDATGKLSGGDMHPVLTLLQHWIDQADPLNYARVVGRFPETGHAPKHVFQTFGLGDTYSTEATMATYAIAGDFAMAAHDPSADPPSTAFEGRTVAPVPLSGNATVETVAYTLAVRQYGPPADRDGHFVAFDVQSASGDVTRFLAMAARGETPQVGE